MHAIKILWPQPELSKANFPIRLDPAYIALRTQVM